MFDMTGGQSCGKIGKRIECEQRMTLQQMLDAYWFVWISGGKGVEPVRRDPATGPHIGNCGNAHDCCLIRLWLRIGTLIGLIDQGRLRARPGTPDQSLRPDHQS